MNLNCLTTYLMRHHFKHFSCDTKINMDAVRLLHAIQQHENVNRRNRDRVMRDHVDPYEFYNNRELLDRFRFNREGLLYIEDLVQEAIERETQRSKALSVRQQLCLALRFYACGSFQQVKIKQLSTVIIMGDQFIVWVGGVCVCHVVVPC